MAPLGPRGVDHAGEIDDGAVAIGPPSTLSAAPKAKHANKDQLVYTSQGNGIREGGGDGFPFHFILFPRACPSWTPPRHPVCTQTTPDPDSFSLHVSVLSQLIY